MGAIQATVEAENKGYNWSERSDVQLWMAGLMCSMGPHPTIRHILLTIAVRMAENGDRSFPGMRALEKRTGLSQRTIVDRLDEAEAEGWVVRLTRRKVGGNGRQYLPAIPGEVLREVQRLERTLITGGAERISALGSAEDASGGAEDPSGSAETGSGSAEAPSNEVLKLSQPSSSWSSSGSRSESNSRENRASRADSLSREIVPEGWNVPSDLADLRQLFKLIDEEAKRHAGALLDLPAHVAVGGARDLEKLPAAELLRIQFHTYRTRGSLA